MEKVEDKGDLEKVQSDLPLDGRDTDVHKSALNVLLCLEDVLLQQDSETIDLEQF